MPARVVGESILRSDFTFSVIEGCSGLRSVVTLSMLAVLMVDLFRRRRLHAVIVVLAAPFVAFGLNAVRAVALIVNPHSSLAAVHVAQGVAILLCGLLVLYALDGLLARLLPRAARARRAVAAQRPPRRGHAGATLAFLALLAGLSVAVAPWVAHDPVPLGSRAPLRAAGRESGRPRRSRPTASSSAACPSGRASPCATSRAASRWICSSGSAIARSASPARCPRRPSGRAAAGSSRSGGGPARDPATATSTLLVERSATRRLLVYHWVDGSAGPLPEALRSLLALDATPWRRVRDPLVVRLATEIGGPGAEERRQAEARLQRFLAEPAGGSREADSRHGSLLDRLAEERIFLNC